MADECKERMVLTRSINRHDVCTILIMLYTLLVYSIYNSLEKQYGTVGSTQLLNSICLDNISREVNDK